MKWNNEAKIFDTLVERLPASSYKADYKFDFESKNVGPGMVQGLDAFIQKFKKVLLTHKTPRITYGLADLLPNSLNQEEFNEQCKKLTYEILHHQFSDSKPGDPNGLGHTVNKVHSIEFDVTKQTYTFVLSVQDEFECPKITFSAPTAILK